jgi:hypothetical protein
LAIRRQLEDDRKARAMLRKTARREARKLRAEQEKVEAERQRAETLQAEVNRLRALLDEKGKASR